ncbi:MAG: dihydropteroate synthase [Thermoleophilia bacterium]
MLAYPPYSVPLDLPCVMGILNVTPDSFSDGGCFIDFDDAVDRGLAMEHAGAAIIDIGGESTRPGSDPVSLGEELRRTIPVVAALRPRVSTAISIDTCKAEVARQALAAGATIINDVSALRLDPELVDVVAESGCGVCLMHMRGLPKTMQDDPYYDDVVSEVLAFLEQRLTWALAHGVREQQIAIDPGIGFGKTVEHNLLLLRHLHRFAELGRPIVLGTSRKRFLGALLQAEPNSRAVGTAATTVAGALAGAAIFRVHDVEINSQALRVARAVLGAGERA